ncbi:MAG: SBBP repeat-containing protein [Bacteroidia bacterium]
MLPFQGPASRKWALAVDGSGNAYVAGNTSSPSLPWAPMTQTTMQEKMF